ncbi:hypothetical protein BDZ97DRAFT_1349926 [Flammula alnicola]|nr:hypothetical protein BDZ97DRAFT_1349926 [Flammula alnicola]
MLRNALFRAKLPDPPTPHLLRSNVPPSESEAILIHVVIAEANAEEQRLHKLLLDRPDSGIASWKMVTRHKIARAAKFVHAHEAITSCIRRMPPEILQEIFSFISKDPTSHDQHLLKTRDLPWAPSQVCRSWRAIALSLPSLWNHLPTVDVTRTTKAKTKFQKVLLSELFRRSANTLLTVRIYAPSCDLGSSHPVIDLLVQYSERWETVIIDLTPATIACIQGVRDRLPSLRTLKLTISLRSPDDDGYPGTRLDIFEVAPQLRSAHVKGSYFGEIVLPLQHLVHCKHELASMFQINQMCDSSVLKTLTLSENSERHFDLGEIIRLPHLVKLDFETYRSAETSLLQCISFPAIEDLHIIVRSRNVLQTLTSAILRSGFPCPLKTLFLRTMFASNEPDLTTLLELTPELVELDITMPSHREILDLARVKQDQPLVPRLEVCTFQVKRETGADSETAGIVSQLATSRCEADESRSEYCELIWTPSTTSSELERLKHKLHQEIPKFNVWYLDPPTKSDRKWRDRVCTILTDIESVEITDARDILMSGLHLSLRIFEQAALLPKVKEHFLAYPRRIQEKWKTLIEQSPSVQLQDIHWALDLDKNLCCVTYIDKNHAFRETPEVFSKMLIYGIDNKPDAC